MFSGCELTHKGQDDSEQRGCWEGNGHVHLQHLKKIHWGGSRDQTKTQRAQATPAGAD